MKYKTVNTLNDAIEITVRPRSYASMIKYAGLLDLLKNEYEFAVDDLEWMLSNFAGLVSRTVKISDSGNPDLEGHSLANGWVELWKHIEVKEYLPAFEMFLEMNVIDDVLTLTNIWDDAISSTEDTLGKDDDLAPPEKLPDSEKKDPTS
jgi:hypothetical protein